jgi:hypothetical protein
MTANDEPTPPDSVDSSARTPIYGETRRGADDLYARIIAEHPPRNVFDEIDAREYAEQHIQAEIFDNMIAELINSRVQQGLFEVLANLGIQDHQALAEAWVDGSASARRRVGNILTSAGLSEKTIAAEAYAARHVEIEHLIRLFVSKVTLRDRSRVRLECRRLVDDHLSRLAAPDVVEAEIVEESPEMVTP